MKQRNLPGVGRIYMQFAGSALYFTAANLAMSGVILWQTTVSGWAARNLPWLTFPVYLLLAACGIFAVMNIHWFFVERSRNATAGQQAYIQDNPAVRDLATIKADLVKIKERLEIEREVGDRMNIVAVIPAYNEAKHIEGVVKGTRPHVSRVLVTDDNSSDGTVLLAQDAGAHVVTNEGKRGYGSNLLHGISHAREFKPDVIVILDGDGQHDPGEIPLLLAPLRANTTDVVMGCRTNGHGMPTYRRMGNRVLSFVCNAGAHQVLPDALSGFWAVRTEAMPDLTERGWGLAIELLVTTRAAGWRLGGVGVRPIYHDNYSENSTATPLHLGWALLTTIIKWRVRCELLGDKKRY